MKKIFVVLSIAVASLIGLFLLALFMYAAYIQYWPIPQVDIPVTTGKRIIDNDPEPLRPDIEKSNSTLLGIDSDQDGVRDDFEIWINHYFKRSHERKYFKKLYSYYVKMMLANKGKSEAMKSYEERSFYFFSCNRLALIFLKNRDKDIDKVREAILNTKERERELNKALLYLRMEVFSVKKIKYFDRKSKQSILAFCPLTDEEYEILMKEKERIYPQTSI